MLNSCWTMKNLVWKSRLRTCDDDFFKAENWCLKAENLHTKLRIYWEWIPENILKNFSKTSYHIAKLKKSVVKQNTMASKAFLKNFCHDLELPMQQFSISYNGEWTKMSFCKKKGFGMAHQLKTCVLQRRERTRIPGKISARSLIPRGDSIGGSRPTTRPVPFFLNAIICL